MIRSMTGFGAADRTDADGVSYVFEVRTVNNRYLKVSLKLPDSLQSADAAVEKLVRARLSRGSVACTLRARGSSKAGSCPIDQDRLRLYVARIAECAPSNGVPVTIDLATLAVLPGVLAPVEPDDETCRQRRLLVEELAIEALDALSVMRRDEGAALHRDLCGICTAIGGELDALSKRAPDVLDEYHDRLRTRVAMLMKDGGFELAADGLAREVALYAERSDIAEEVTRLRSHLEQFVVMCDRDEPTGRSLDFLSQEMLREANTIASKSNDAAIAMHVVEIKGLIDRLKEQVQNVE